MTFWPGNRFSPVVPFLAAAQWMITGVCGEETGTKEAEKPVPVQFQRSQAGIDVLLVRNSDRKEMVGQVSRLALTATAASSAPAGQSAAPSTFEVNQKTGAQLQGSLKAVQQYFAASRGPWPDGYRLELGFEQAGRPQDGASTGLAVTLLLDALVTGHGLDPGVCVTGAITPEGKTTPVMGVIPKIEAAARAGKRIVVIPSGNQRAVGDLLVLKGAMALCEMNLIGVDSAKEAARVADAKRDPSLNAAMVDFARVSRFLRAREYDPSKLREGLAHPRVAMALERVLKNWPGHLSAMYLRLFTNGKAPLRLSLLTSVRRVEQSKNEINRAVGRNAGEELARAIAELQDARSILDETSLRFANAVDDYGRLWQGLHQATSSDERDALGMKIKIAASRIRTELNYLRVMPEVADGLEK